VNLAKPGLSECGPESIGEIEREEREMHTYTGAQQLTPECME